MRCRSGLAATTLLATDRRPDHGERDQDETSEYFGQLERLSGDESDDADGDEQRGFARVS
ncbi:hypothetical protein [Halosimplex salinum]|uniref:hypothetical protein n=1 Tax=Halosimplex salinum TaxID=1710538 RepID=UPI000F45F1F0|nr:hypothetical protein [Halosimplex salinum]